MYKLYRSEIEIFYFVAVKTVFKIPLAVIIHFLLPVPNQNELLKL
jgi:hypothetical protein